MVKHADGAYEIVPAHSVNSGDSLLMNNLVPCQMEIRDDANFVCTTTSAPTNFRIYDRGDPKLNQSALQQALPKFYESFHLPKRQN